MVLMNLTLGVRNAKKHSWRWLSCTHTPSTVTTTARCQFHQHFMSNFFHSSVFWSFSLLTIWLCNFFVERISAQKLLAKCWLNWLQMKSLLQPQYKLSKGYCTECQKPTASLQSFMYHMGVKHRVVFAVSSLRSKYEPPEPVNVSLTGQNRPKTSMGLVNRPKPPDNELRST